MFTTLITNLNSLGYKVSYFETAGEAAQYMDEQIDGQTVGFGGSVSLKEMGLYEKLSSHNTVYWHQGVADQRESQEIRTKAANAAVYVSSVNGISQNGEIINIDGVGNRVASIFYGHEKVYLVIGKNKVAKDYESALYRARNVAAPLNAVRLKRNTPCAVKGDRCYDCKSPDRICRGLSVLWAKPNSGKYEIVLVNQNLGY